ncbi:hypothetical protein V8Z77_19775 [Stutzerimonas stutzeri]|uniref:hypothetical protein n=1 Tax=Stutzerimonas stutzeri TaxID=316 RepID=UPI0031D639CE
MLSIVKGGMDLKKISTFGKYMLCPESLHSRTSEDFSLLGSRDFLKYPYRHHSTAYVGNSTATTKVLLEHIMRSLDMIDPSKKPLLLLSDGKDSMGLALAFSRMGISVDTLTLLRRGDNELRYFVESVCKKLGHRASFIEVDGILNSVSLGFFKHACAYMDAPVLDQGFIYFLFGLKLYFESNNVDPSEYVVVDGLGNDETFGYIPSLNQLRSYKLSKLGLWKVIPSSLKALRWYIRSPSESHGDLSALSCYFNLKGSYDINYYFSGIDSLSDDLGFVDFRAFSRGAFHDHQCMMGKTIVSAQSLGSTVYFPWVEKQLANYVFNLPLQNKFDFKSLTNKLLLRELLFSEVGWQQHKRGVDLYFDLDVDGFKREVFSGFVPDRLIDVLSRGSILPEYVKKRAHLELLNFVGYCRANHMSNADIEDILL